MKASDLIKSSVERIQLAMNDGKFTLRELESIEQIYKKALVETQKTLANARKQLNQESR